MKLIIFECYYVTLLHIIGLYLPILGSRILDTGHYDEINRNYFKLQCSLNCPLGYQTDIEGNPMCKCNDPCMNIFCFGGTKCVLEKPANCEGHHCKPEARCQDVRNKKNPENLPNPNKNEAYDVMNILQRDSVTKIDDQHAVCFQDLPTDAFRCRKKRRRYFYDSISGLCIKFKGCESQGNNFARKRDCKRLCIKGRKSKDTAKSPVLSDIREDPASSYGLTSGSCTATLAEVTVTCPSALAKRWYFSSRKGICIRIKGCASSDKLFRKRRDCKRQCMKRQTGRGRKRARNRKMRSKRRNQKEGKTAS